MTRLLKVASRTAFLIFCGVLLILAPSMLRWGHRSRSSEAQSTPPHPHSVDLQWKPSPSRVVGYNVYRSQKTGGPFTKLTPNPIAMTNYTDQTVQSGNTYFYMVKAVDDNGRESQFSNQIKAVIPSP